MSGHKRTTPVGIHGVVLDDAERRRLSQIALGSMIPALSAARPHGGIPPLAAMWLLRSLPTASLGQICAAILPAALIGEIGRPSRILLAGISIVLAEREHAA